MIHQLHYASFCTSEKGVVTYISVSTRDTTIHPSTPHPTPHTHMVISHCKQNINICYKNAFSSMITAF